MSDEFTTPTGPSTDTTPNLIQQTTTEELTTPTEQQEKVDEMLPSEPQEKESQQIEQDDEEQNPIQMQTEKSLGKQQTTTEELTTPAEQQDDVDEMQPPEPQQIDQDDEEQNPIQMQTEKSLGKEPQRPETRTEKRQVKAINPLKSPYLTRQVDMKRPWTATEKSLGNGFCKMTMLIPPYGDNALRTKRFSERMDNEIRQTEGLNLQDIELFVFPIVHSQHYFVLTVNVKNKRFDILDNSSSDSPRNEKYGDVPTTLKTMLAEYFHIKEDDAKSNLVKALTPARLRMSWRDNSNKVDCGVFTMRHMETYMGKGTKGWDCGLEKENKEQLNNTRVKYLAEIVNSPINEFCGDCMKDARQFEKASKAKK
nr:uncharacterized protein LOC109162486 [Ipomoea batatas]